MPKIAFKIWEQVAEFHNPTKNGEMDRQKIEVRLDPLTEHQSILNDALKGKISTLFPETDYAYLQQRIDDTKEQCFMCDGKWRKTSPRYPEHLIPQGRIARGEIVLFPNLFPLAPYHAVVMVGQKHGEPWTTFPPRFSSTVSRYAWSSSEGASKLIAKRGFLPSTQTSCLPPEAVSCILTSR
jgi:hypothetical protein